MATAKKKSIKKTKTVKTPFDEPTVETPVLPASVLTEEWPIERFIPYVNNPRKNDAVVDQMASSILEFGFKIPILARSSGEIVDGHLRLKAAQKLNLPSLPVILCDEWTPAQVTAFRLMVNRSVEWADWDEELLAVEFEKLREVEFDLSLTGFNLDEIEKVSAAAAAGSENTQPPTGFNEYDESIETEHECPKCGYRWSGGKTTVKTTADGTESEIDDEVEE